MVTGRGCKEGYAEGYTETGVLDWLPKSWFPSRVSTETDVFRRLVDSAVDSAVDSTFGASENFSSWTVRSARVRKLVRTETVVSARSQQAMNAPLRTKTRQPFTCAPGCHKLPGGCRRPAPTFKRLRKKFQRATKKERARQDLCQPQKCRNPVPVATWWLHESKKEKTPLPF